MKYANTLRASTSCLLILAFTTLNAVADEIVSYSDGAIPIYQNADITPDDAYRQLVAGNARYLKEDSSAARDLPPLSSAQNRFPIASIVYSSDMPVKPTVLTQTSDHDLYMTTMELGAVSNEELTSIEYGLINLQTPLLVVLGHYPSRTVASLIRQFDDLEEKANGEAANIGTPLGVPRGSASEQMKLYNLVGPAIARSREAYPDIQGYDLANVVSEALVWQSLETILLKSTVAQDLIRAGRLNIIAAIADDKTGKIYWLGAHPLQEEFLKPLPDAFADKEASGILAESELPSPLDDVSIQEYVSIYENDPYYEDVVSEYYVSPIFYQPSWELFSPRAWTYRPWYGVWYDPFVPWPYWNPWDTPHGESSLGVSQWDGRLRFFVAYNRSYGVPIYYDPNYRPHDPWWRSDYFVSLDRRRHDVVFDLIVSGRRTEVPNVVRTWRPPHEPHGYRPGVARPRIVVGLGGLSIGISGSSRRPPHERRNLRDSIAPPPNEVPRGGASRLVPVQSGDSQAHLNHRRDTPRNMVSSERLPSSPRTGRGASEEMSVRPNVPPNLNNHDSRVVPNGENSRNKPSGLPSPFPTRGRTVSPRGAQSTLNTDDHLTLDLNTDSLSPVTSRDGESRVGAHNRPDLGSGGRSAVFPSASQVNPVLETRPNPNLNPNTHDSNIESRDGVSRGSRNRIPRPISAGRHPLPPDSGRFGPGVGIPHGSESRSFIRESNDAFSHVEGARPNQTDRATRTNIGQTGASTMNLPPRSNVGLRPNLNRNPVVSDVGTSHASRSARPNSPIRSDPSPALTSRPRADKNVGRPPIDRGYRPK